MPLNKDQLKLFTKATAAFGIVKRHAVAGSTLVTVDVDGDFMVYTGYTASAADILDSPYPDVDDSVDCKSLGTPQEAHELLCALAEIFDVKIFPKPPATPLIKVSA